MRPPTWRLSASRPRHGPLDSPRTVAPADAEAHRQFARWAGTFESDRRYGEKLLQILPEALYNSIGRPGIYTSALAVAQNLGQLQAYRAILKEHLGSRPGDQVLPHHLDSAQVTLVNLADEGRIRTLKDSLEAVLDELGARHWMVPQSRSRCQTSGLQVARIPAGNRLKSYRTARSAFPAGVPDPAGSYRKSGKTGLNGGNSRPI